MRILMLGVNHRSASLDQREQLALSGPELDGFVQAFREQYPFAELVILATCNRTEIYAARPIHDAPTMDDLRQFVATQRGMTVETLTPITIHRESEQAVQHLFQVTAGLDSMVLGEAQILGHAATRQPMVWEPSAR